MKRRFAAVHMAAIGGQSRHRSNLSAFGVAADIQDPPMNDRYLQSRRGVAVQLFQRLNGGAINRNNFCYQGVAKKGNWEAAVLPLNYARARKHLADFSEWARHRLQTRWHRP